MRLEIILKGRNVVLIITLKPLLLRLSDYVVWQVLPKYWASPDIEWPWTNH